MDLLVHGKSTILNLINRNFELVSGDLNIYGKNIKEYSFSFLKDSIISISQIPEFFEGTIYENVSLYKNISITDFSYAAKLSLSSDFINKLPDKELSKVKLNASNFSGGQKQRLALARIFTRKPKILLLDDVTSAVDITTEKNILKNIKDFSKSNNITTIITSQKISSLSICDNIIVLDNGNIEAIGNHDFLINNSIIYKKIYDIQNTKEV